MKIIELFGENVKKIIAVRIRPKENVVVISGANGAGKTSALDLMWFCLGGGDSLKDTPQPIRKGQTKARAITVLAEPTEEEELAIENGEDVTLKPLFTVTRTWTEKGTYLKITNAEGKKIQEPPQELLDSFKSRLSFDPLKFSQMKENDQRELLLKLADIDLEVLDNEIADIREQRRVQGQEVKLLTGEREEVTRESLPEEALSIIEINDELQKANYENQQLERNVEGLEDAKHELRKYELEVERFKLIKKGREVYISNHKIIDVSSIKSRLLEAESINQEIRARDRNRDADEKEENSRAKYDGLTSKVEELEDIKKGILDDAKMPIVGFCNIVGKEKPAGVLGVSDTGVTFNGIPFSQLSTSEKLVVGMGLGMAKNPRLKVLRITDGSLLDDKNMEMIKKMANYYDFQIWIEKVNTSGEIGFFIEEGEVKAINGEKTDNK